MLSYQIAVKNSAAKSLKKIPRSDRKRIAEKIEHLAENSPSPDTTKIKGDNPFHKVRVGNYRIIYQIQNDILLILIVKTGHRKDIYPKLA